MNRIKQVAFFIKSFRTRRIIGRSNGFRIVYYIRRKEEKLKQQGTTVWYGNTSLGGWGMRTNSEAW